MRARARWARRRSTTRLCGLGGGCARLARAAAPALGCPPAAAAGAGPTAAIWQKRPAFAALPLYPRWASRCWPLFLAPTAGSRAAAKVGQLGSKHNKRSLSPTPCCSTCWSSSRLRPQPCAACRRNLAWHEHASRQMRCGPADAPRLDPAWLPFCRSAFHAVEHSPALAAQRWQAAAAERARLAARPGEFEALAALATPHHDHPHWASDASPPAQTPPCRRCRPPTGAPAAAARRCRGGQRCGGGCPARSCLSPAPT